MKINGYSFRCESPFFVYFKKHRCPSCSQRLSKIKVSEIVHSDDENANPNDFEIADITVKGNVKFTHIEFRCPDCKKQYTVKQLKEESV